MNAPTPSELEREARRVMRKLVTGMHLMRCANGDYAIAVRGRPTKTRLAAALANAMRARGWLEEKAGVLALSQAGAGWYARATAALDPFAAQHQLRRTQTITDEQGRERAVAVNAAESPLAWMHQRGLVDDLQCEAGERLRRDFTLAQLSPRLGVDYSAPVAFGRRAAKPGLLPDTVIAAKQRFSRAMTAAGPGLSDILFDVCCHLNGLEQSEKARGWPRASAKVVLRIALDRLARHYGMNCTRPRAAIRAWAADDDAS